MLNALFDVIRILEQFSQRLVLASRLDKLRSIGINRRVIQIQICAGRASISAHTHI